MNAYLVAAAALAVTIGVVHSALGEVMVFSRLRQRGLVPTDGGSVLESRHVRILWASWHLLTVFGWAFAVVLLRLAVEPTAGGLRTTLLLTVAGAMLLGSVVVCYATKARHPGWIGLLGIAALCWLGGAP